MKRILRKENNIGRVVVMMIDDDIMMTGYALIMTSVMTRGNYYLMLQKIFMT